MDKGRFKCPLCHSTLTKTRYYDIIGVWEERQKIEMDLKNQLKDLKRERTELVKDRKRIERDMKKKMRLATKEAEKKGQLKEKKRADKLSEMIQGKAQRIQELNKKVKELQEQLEKGTTPQLEGLNLEKELINELTERFPNDNIEHHGKAGDIVQYVSYKGKNAGSILYECKRTERFLSKYINQVKNALAKRHATYGVLVTTAFKKDTAGFWVEKDIIVVHPFGATHIAQILRFWILEMQSLKLSKAEMDERAKDLLVYIKGDDFKNTIEDSIYRTRELAELLRKEADTHMDTWRTRYDYYKSIHDNVCLIKQNSTRILKGDKPLAVLELSSKYLPPLKVISEEEE